VRDDVAIVDGTWDIKGAHDQSGGSAPEEKGRFTAVAKKQGSRWFIVAQREMIPASL
jgi:ketosteroid isomerase-like protein